MQQAINSKEHNTAFIKFLFLFFLTIAMVAGALYFDFQTPQKELQILRERSDMFRNQNLAQENYKKMLIDAMLIIDQLDSNSSRAVVESELYPKISALRAAASPDDSTTLQHLNIVINDLVYKYRDARVKLQNFKEVQSELDKKDATIDDLRKKLNDCTSMMPLQRQ